jgi:hypothetical protein
MISIIGVIEEDTRDLTGIYKTSKHKPNQIIRRQKPMPNQSNKLNLIVNKT